MRELSSGNRGKSGAAEKPKINRRSTPDQHEIGFTLGMLCPGNGGESTAKVRQYIGRIFRRETARNSVQQRPKNRPILGGYSGGGRVGQAAAIPYTEAMSKAIRLFLYLALYGLVFLAGYAWAIYRLDGVGAGVDCGRMARL